MKTLLSPHYLTICALTLGNFSAFTKDATQHFDLKSLEAATASIADPCREATVGMSIGNAQGTGVIIDPKGLILTAHHCVDYEGREFEVILSDGNRAKAIAVYSDKASDTALALILDPAPEGGWPHRPLRPVDSLGDLKDGDWCVAYGNGGGLQLNRPAPMRLGRVLGLHEWQGVKQFITDNTVVSGDSGGPLFDIEGRVAGITSNVSPKSALANHHARLSIIMDMWGDTIRGEKALPEVDALRELGKKNALEAQKKAKKSTLSEEQKEQTSELLRKQYGEDFPQEVIDIILKNSALNAKTGAMNIQITPSVLKEITAAGHDLVKLGLITEEQNKQLEELNQKNKEQANEQPATPRTEEEQTIEKLLKQQYKGQDIPAEALDLMISVAKYNPEKKQLNLPLTKEHLERLKKLGFDPLAKQKKAKQDEVIKQALQKKYDGKLTDEALAIMMDHSHYNPKTGELKIELSPEGLAKLQELGFLKDEQVKSNKVDYDKLAGQFGDSAADISESFPKTPEAIPVYLDDAQVCLATPIRKEGLLLTKASELGDKAEVHLLVKGQKIAAKVMGKDETSDLALLKIDQELTLPTWTENTSNLGQLVVSPGADKSTLGVIGNRPRLIPEKLIGAGNGNKAVLGIKAHPTNESDKGVLIEEADEHLPAGAAGIKKGDIITHIQGVAVANIEALSEQVGKFIPGDKVELIVLREEKTLIISATLEDASGSELFAMNATSSTAQKISAKGGKLSTRRMNFPECLTHDALIWATDCGGPLYNREGKMVGINIARYDRTASYALTRKSVEEALKRLLQN
ncbi:serine protease, S1-C subfamily, contains C-terminal PDZ domain [Rubritalea squalenifaciens DSM 18772]|uniref:Serine protease, S1-C subfamily, contains C-terminal PDZ domain n=1 Tax=Rubritalea squalenifaciens DSM 18772 TaxID=1123071 RepID=A0A1M6NBT7_9BACT|nr:trypsin-like peptidase domain-containing protein [Rubritalea squalenifaciens]SHJ93006.1 serine protease, S1-C subfamily, contains C-terminal PDZ domain [Rubritalea squalenifaciens DSM 18772]